MTVGTVSDAQTAAGSLTVTRIAGGTATGITSTNGTVTALVSASCPATSGTVRFQVSDGSLTGIGDLQVNVTAAAVPTISAQPVAQEVCVGSTATFSVTAANAASYQWRKNGTNISGATGSSYTTPPTVAGDNGALYSVVVGGTCGPPVTSNDAVLTVNDYSLSSPSGAFPASGGTGSVNVTAAAICPWTALSNDAWIQITAGASGMGNGQVNYTVSSNSGSARSGTVTIAGPTYTVNQSAPTAIELVSFNATSYDKGTLIEWRTGQEANNLGFRFYREEAGKRELPRRN